MRRGPKLDTRMIIGGVIALIVVVAVLAALGGGTDLFGTGGRNRDRNNNNNDQNNNQGGGDQNQGGGDQNNQGGGDQNQGGGDQNQGGGDQNQGGGNNNQGGGDQNQGGGDQNQGNQNQGGGDQNQGGGDQNQGNQGGGDQNQGGGNQNQGNQNQGGGDQNQGGGNQQQPTDVPVQPTAVPVQPTAVPVQPTDVPVQPTDVPVQPTDVPVQPTDVPAQPTEAEVVAVQPTTAPTTEPTRRGGNTNQDGTRPDRSSLGVTVSCDGGNAVFTISNHGEAGNGDMVSSTTYRVINDTSGAEISNGSVQLRGGASTTVTIASNGVKVRLIANQQVGHPGTGVAQADTTCGSGGAVQPTTESTVVPTTAPTQVAVQSTTAPTTAPTQQNAVQPTTAPTQSSGRGNNGGGNNSSSERLTICHVTPSQGIILDNMPRSSLNGHFDNNGNLHGSDFLITNDDDRARCENSGRETNVTRTPDERVSICHVTPSQGIVLDNMPRSSLNGHFDNNGNLHGSDFLITSDSDRERCEGTGREEEPQQTPEERVSICHVTPSQGIVLDNMPRSSLNGHFDNNGNLHGNDFLITSDSDRERCEGTRRTEEPQQTPEERVSICHVTPSQGIVLDNMPRSSLNGHFDNNGNLHGSDFLITSDADRERCEGTGHQEEPQQTPEERVSICHVTPAHGVILDNMPRSSLNGHFDNNGNLHGSDFLITNDDDRARCEGTGREEEPTETPESRLSICHVTPAQGIILDNMPRSSLNGHFDNNGNLHGNDFLITNDDDRTRCEDIGREPRPERTPEERVSICHVTPAQGIILDNMPRSSLNGHFDNNGNLHGNDFLITSDADRERCEGTATPEETPESELPPPPVVAAVCVVDGDSYSVQVVDASEVANLLSGNPSSFVMGENDTCEAPPAPPVEIAVCVVNNEGYSVVSVAANSATELVNANPGSYIITNESPSCEAPTPPPAVVSICRVEGNSYSVEVVNSSEVESLLNSSPSSYVLGEGQSCEATPPPPAVAAICHVTDEGYSVEVIDASEVEAFLSDNPDSYVLGAEDTCEAPPVPPVVVAVCQVDGDSYSVTTVDIDALPSLIATYPASFVLEDSLSCEPPAEPPAELAICHVTDEGYSVEVLETSEAEAILDTSVNSYIITDESPACEPPAIVVPVCLVDGDSYTVEVVDATRANEIVSSNPGSYVVGESSPACEPTEPNEPGEPEPTDVPVVSLPEEPIAGWTPITVGGAVCEDWVLYHSNETGDWEIFRLGELPDGQTGDRNLSHGENATDLAPVRSPDNQWIAFVSDRDGNWEIYVGSVDGSQQIRVTYNEVTDLDPVWSPDGTKLAYESMVDGNWEIRLFDLIIGQSTRLTNNEANDANPFWNLDGTTLVFQSNRDGLEQLYLLDVATQAVTKLSDGTANDMDPQFSNDGTMVLFRSDRNGGSLDATNVFYMMADGTGITQVSENGGNAMNAVWSPDDRLIAYQSDINAGVNDIYVYELSTSTTRLVTNNEGDNQTIEDISPTWICESTTLVFSSHAEGDYDIYFVPAEPITNDSVEMTHETAQTVDPDEAAPFTDVDPENSPAEENASRNDALLPSTNGN